jgi:hypothetical protein
MYGYFMQDNATDCRGNSQMTTLEERFSKLLATHALWPAKQKNLKEGDYYLCATRIHSAYVNIRHSLKEMLGNVKEK